MLFASSPGATGSWQGVWRCSPRNGSGLKPSPDGWLCCSCADVLPGDGSVRIWQSSSETFSGWHRWRWRLSWALVLKGREHDPHSSKFLSPWRFRCCRRLSARAKRFLHTLQTWCLWSKEAATVKQKVYYYFRSKWGRPERLDAPNSVHTSSVHTMFQASVSISICDIPTVLPNLFQLILFLVI